MDFPKKLRRLSVGWRVAILTLSSGLVGLALNSLPVTAWLQAGVRQAFPGLIAGEAAYLAFVVQALLIGVSLILLVLAVVWLEEPRDFREFFKLGPLDWRG